MPAPSPPPASPPADTRFRHLVELAPDAILVHDGRRVTFANPAALRLAGATRPEQLVGRPVGRFLTPPYFKSVETQLAAMTGAVELTAPVRDTFRRLDGSTVEVELRAVAFLDDGRPAVHLVLRDITERLAAERSLQQLEERLAEAQHQGAIGNLAGGVAHEVNNMLEVVVGLGAFLLQEPWLPASGASDVREIMAAADRAATVTRQLLAFSRRATHRPGAVALGAVVHEAEPVLRRVLGTSCRLVVHVVGNPWVRADAGQLQELLLHLARNAREAMPDGGTLTVTVQPADLPGHLTPEDPGGVLAGGSATLHLQDTGTGMEPAVVDRIFEPFFTTKPSASGTGLGLAAVRGIVAQHGGQITVDSAPGRGTAFTVRLPLVADGAPAETAAPAPASRSAPVPAGATVLVVDDEPAVRRVAARSLERGGYRVLEAEDGGAALALVEREGPPTLLLTDLTMPGIGGVELARLVRERWPAVPILFMSGYPAEELQRQGGAAAARDLIEKPFAPAELTARVTAALARTLVPASAAG